MQLNIIIVYRDGANITTNLVYITTNMYILLTLYFIPLIKDILDSISMKNVKVYDNSTWSLEVICLIFEYMIIIIEYPLNLSILLKGGKETNKDFLSNGEWIENNSNGKTHLFFRVCCCFICNKVNLLENSTIEGDSPVTFIYYIKEYICLVKQMEYKVVALHLKLNIMEYR